MSDSKLSTLLGRHRMIAILRLDDLTHARGIVDALLDGGIRIVEFTLTNPDAPRCIETLIQEIPIFGTNEAALGLGSVRNRSEAKLAHDHGAQFLVSPILNFDVMEYACDHSIPALPGVMTPTEMAQAWDLGARILKLFPARNLGPAYVRDCLAPMPYLNLVPTGGVDESNLRDYLRAGSRAVGVGSQLLPHGAVQSRDWESIRKAAATYVDLVTSSSPS